MTIRPAHDSDIPAIVQLLKISLGESLMPKSEAFWRWKHIDNPFGRSPVLLAETDGILIGVRAFMRWEWSLGNKIVKAVRAVDTATHPDFQGKGIFKELTLQLVSQCKEEGVDFIFNTPNSSSMPGYLKMGWQKFGRMKLRAFPVMPSFTKNTEMSNNYYGDAEARKLRSLHIDTLATNPTKHFLAWRYGRNPNYRYQELTDENNRVIFRIKKGSRLNEFRIVEACFDGKYGKEFRSLILQEARAQQAHVITWAGFDLPLVSFALPVGPIITINMLQPNFQGLIHWRPTLGDMEVF